MKKNNENYKKSTKLLICYFEVKGLFGYKDIRIDFDKSITITAAENGNGKTTILNIFYAVVSGNVDLLKKYIFTSVGIMFSDDQKPIVLNYEELLDKTIDLSFDDRDKLSLEVIEQNIIDQIGEEQFFHILEIIKNNHSKNKGNIIHINSLLQKADLPRLPSFLIKKLEENYGLSNKKLGEIRKKILNNDLNILYFPTYRRIESYALDDNSNEGENTFYYKKLRRNNVRHRWDKTRLMNFGLDDVDAQLNSICEEITRITLRTYSEIGRSILDDLLTPKSNSYDEKLIDPKKLAFVLSRLEKGDEATVSKINMLISSGDIKKPENSALASLLVQLNEIYKKTEINEKAIENFATVINSYWAANNPQEKEFIFDKANVKTYVKNLVTGSHLELNSLSSGEKQIISMFARLYLNTDKKNYIILIDEPELSLSLEWQRKFLVDVTNSPNCHQLFAITHSPFIFENALDKYAKPFYIKNQVIEK